MSDLQHDSLGKNEFLPGRRGDDIVIKPIMGVDLRWGRIIFHISTLWGNLLEGISAYMYMSSKPELKSSLDTDLHKTIAPCQILALCQTDLNLKSAYRTTNSTSTEEKSI